jgi:hypothetical protein
MKINRSQIIAVVIMLVIGAVWVKSFWFTEVFRTHKSNEPHRKALVEIHHAVAIGASHADVLAAYWQHQTDSLRLFAGSPTSWSITMPLELGASDWNLLFEFKDNRVVAVRVRTSDGPPPRDGPKDKQNKAD